MIIMENLSFFFSLNVKEKSIFGITNNLVTFNRIQFIKNLFVLHVIVEKNAMVKNKKKNDESCII